MSSNNQNAFDIMSGDNRVATYVDNELIIIDVARCPIQLRNTKDFSLWLSQRAIDGSRHNSRSLKRAFMLSSFEDDYNTAKVMNGASITDNYWIKASGSNLAYSDVEYKQNDFFQAALSIDKSLRLKKPTRTPELTNIGSKEKGWSLEDGAWWLYKNESKSEIEAEYLTYKIGQLMGYNMAEYEIVGDCEYIKTKDFTEGKYNLQHARAIVGEDEDYNFNYNTFKEISIELCRDYVNILVLDILCGNVDRHTENYGILTSRETGELIGFAPNYDNNESFGTYRDIHHADLAGGTEIKLLQELAEIQDININLPVLDKVKASEIINKTIKYSDDKVEDIKEFLFNRYDHLAKESYVSIANNIGENIISVKKDKHRR